MVTRELSFISSGSRATLAYPFRDKSGRGEVRCLGVGEEPHKSWLHVIVLHIESEKWAVTHYQLKETVGIPKNARVRVPRVHA